MSFEFNIQQMQDFYRDTERQFIELTHIIPLDNDWKVYSPRFYNILQSSCGQIESMFRILCDKLKIEFQDDKRRNFPNYFKKLNVDKMLEIQSVTIIQNEITVQPFKLEENQEIPIWWQKYNQTKHNLPMGLFEGNIENTVFALSSLYSLHIISHYAQYVPTDKLLQRKGWNEPIRVDLKLILSPDSRNRYQPIFDSEIFYFVNKFVGDGAWF